MSVTRHTATALLDGTPVTVLDGLVTLDAEWAPYARAEITVPATPAMLALDPRAGEPRLSLRLRETTGRPGLISQISADYLGDWLQHMAWPGKRLGTFSTVYATPWQPGAPFRSSSRHLDLTVTRVEIRHDRHEVILTAHGAELTAQGDLLLAPAPLEYQAATLADLARTLLGAHLVATTNIPLAGLDLTRDPGQSVWRLLEPLVDLAGARLWCDELGTWHLDPATLTGVTRTGLDLTRATTITDTRGGQWAGSVVLTTQHIDAAGATQRSVDVAGAGPPGLARTRASRLHRAGAAQAILDRAIRRGRRATLTGVSRYDLTPGDTLPEHGLVTAVAWALADHTMTITTREEP